MDKFLLQERVFVKLTRNQAKVVRLALESWRKRKLISPQQTAELASDIKVVRFDWRRLSKYSMRISIVCLISSVTAIFADEAFIELMEKLFNAPELAQSILCALLASFFFWWGCCRRRNKPEKIYTNETIFFFGVLFIAASISLLGAALEMGDGHFSVLLLFAALIYGLLGLLLPSRLVWVFSLLSLGSWMGAETGYASGWGAYYLGMSYPVRFLIFGILLTAIGYRLRRLSILARIDPTTRVMGLLYMFISLWIMSIFGNYGEIENWYKSRLENFHWVIYFGLVAGLAIVYGLKRDDRIARGFGLTFLSLNLYTRFFEYFWGPMHKAAFFGILGISLWYIGSKAEAIWALGGTMEDKDFEKLDDDLDLENEQWVTEEPLAPLPDPFQDAFESDKRCPHCRENLSSIQISDLEQCPACGGKLAKGEKLVSKKCSQCEIELSEYSLGGVDVEYCSGCTGVWFNLFELDDVLRRREDVKQDLKALSTSSAVTPSPDSKRRCPKCRNTTLTRHYHPMARGVQVEECPKCGGYWIERNQLDSLLA